MLQAEKNGTMAKSRRPARFEDFGTRLQGARRGVSPAMSQEELGDRLGGVHPVTISKWERGTNFPSGEMLVRLSEVLKVSLDWLAGRPVVSSLALPSSDVQANTRALHDLTGELQALRRRVAALEARSRAGQGRSRRAGPPK